MWIDFALLIVGRKLDLLLRQSRSHQWLCYVPVAWKGHAEIYVHTKPPVAVTIDLGLYNVDSITLIRCYSPPPASSTTLSLPGTSVSKRIQYQPLARCSSPKLAAPRPSSPLSLLSCPGSCINIPWSHASAATATFSNGR